jgi:hypothetical protein
MLLSNTNNKSNKKNKSLPKNIVTQSNTNHKKHKSNTKMYTKSRVH